MNTTLWFCLALSGVSSAADAGPEVGPASVLDEADLIVMDTDHDTVPDSVEIGVYGTDPLWDETTCAPAWPEHVVDGSIVNPKCVWPADLDDDGDIDLIAAESDGHRVLWYENDGAGGFGAAILISSDVVEPRHVSAADLDGDGVLDVISASNDDNKVAWYQGLGGGSFGPQNVVTDRAHMVYSVHAEDMDLDGDIDLVVGSGGNDTVSYHANLGDGTFEPEVVISDSVDYPYSVHAADFDQDGDPDIVFVADDSVVWNENLGGGAFGPNQLIDDSSNALRSVRAADLDGDGLIDIAAGSASTSKLFWHQNLGGGAFGPARFISGSQSGIRSMFAEDIDRDGDVDLMAASARDGTVAWYENQGNGVFTKELRASGSTPNAWWVHAADVDGDNDTDLLSLSSSDFTLLWFENEFADDVDGDGLSRGAEQCIVGTHHEHYDTDAGGVNDLAELIAGTDPSDISDDVWSVDRTDYERPPTDSDLDGVLDSHEWAAGTSPYATDSDLDGMPDDVEFGPDHDNPFNHDGDSVIDALDNDDDNDRMPTAQEGHGHNGAGQMDYINADSHELSLTSTNVVIGEVIDLHIDDADPGETLVLLTGIEGLGPEAPEIGGATMGLVDATPVDTAVADGAGSATIRVYLPPALIDHRVDFQAVSQGVDPKRSNVHKTDLDGS